MYLAATGFGCWDNQSKKTRLTSDFAVVSSTIRFVAHILQDKSILHI